VPKSAILDLKEFKDQTALRKLEEGMPVTQSAFFDERLHIMPKGYRAVAVKCPPEAAAGDVILPGHRVDLLCTVSDSKGRVTKTFLSNVLVLATAQRADRDEGGKPQEPSATLWLALKPEDVERVIWLGGAITPVVRRPDDNEEATTPGARSPFKREDELPEKTTILVAVQTLRKGTVLEDPTDFFELRECPKNTVVEGALRDLKKLKGKRVMRTLPTNSQVTDDDLGEPEAK
jgi:Flp pilus assembly protein CpaB